jgi:hypothetical protein
VSVTGWRAMMPLLTARPKPITTREDVEAFVFSAYPPGHIGSCLEGIDNVMRLLPERRCRIDRKPKFLCQTSTSTFSGDHKWSEDGQANVAYANSIAVQCPNRGHIYTEEWHGGLTQGVVYLVKCFEHFDSVGYFEACEGFRNRYLVIGARRAYPSVSAAIRARR